MEGGREGSSDACLGVTATPPSEVMAFEPMSIARSSSFTRVLVLWGSAGVVWHALRRRAGSRGKQKTRLKSV